MGLGGLWRLLKGEPVFQPPPPPIQETPHAHALEPDQTGESPSPHAQAPAGPKVLPVLRIQEFVECRLEGDNMRCEIRVRNQSTKQLELKGMEFLGHHFPNDRVFSPGGEYEFMVFDGKRPTSTGNQEAELHYRDETGDYFSTRHHVDMEKAGDNTYKITRVRYLEIHDDHAV
jgi:hypothetical protein